MLNVDVRRNYRDAMPVPFLPNCPENNHYIESYNVFFLKINLAVYLNKLLDRKT